jgi:hypothetical protein
MDKQNIDEVVEHLLATRQSVSKAELRTVVELVHVIDEAFVQIGRGE